MTIKQANKLIKDWCIHYNDCSYNCHVCPTWIKLIKCDYPEEFNYD